MGNRNITALFFSKLGEVICEGIDSTDPKLLGRIRDRDHQTASIVAVGQVDRVRAANLAPCREPVYLTERETSPHYFQHYPKPAFSSPNTWQDHLNRKYHLTGS